MLNPNAEDGGGTVHIFTHKEGNTRQGVRLKRLLKIQNRELNPYVDIY